MTEYRAGYDVSQIEYLAETDFGVTPTTGAWKPIQLATFFDPKPQKRYKPKIGFGRQLPSQFINVKEWAEFTIENELLAKVVSPAHEWIDIFYYIMTNAAFGATFNLGQRLKSLSIGAKLDLTTDEYWWLKGCKFNRFELSSAGVDEVIKATIAGIAQFSDYGTTDYVSGSATRTALAAATTAYIRHPDCGIEIKPYGGAYGSIYDRVNNWSFVIERNLGKKGSATGNAKLYAAFPEEKVDVSLKVSVDFNSRTDLEQFIDATQIDAKLLIPSGSGGRQIILPSGNWLQHGSPHREIDLIAVDLTAQFTDVNVTTIA